MSEQPKPPPNKNLIITASEINRFIYCGRGWFYERYYGRPYIRKLYNERNAKLGYDDPSLGKFAQGNEFHKNYLFVQHRRRFYKALVFFVIVIIITAFIVMLGRNYSSWR